MDCEIRSRPPRAQSFRREDNALPPLSGLESAVVYEAALPSLRWDAKL